MTIGCSLCFLRQRFDISIVVRDRIKNNAIRAAEYSGIQPVLKMLTYNVELKVPVKYKNECVPFSLTVGVTLTPLTMTNQSSAAGFSSHIIALGIVTLTKPTTPSKLVIVNAKRPYSESKVAG